MGSTQKGVWMQIFQNWWKNWLVGQGVVLPFTRAGWRSGQGETWWRRNAKSCHWGGITNPMCENTRVWASGEQCSRRGAGDLGGCQAEHEPAKSPHGQEPPGLLHEHKKSFFTVRMVKPWNRLPGEVVGSRVLAILKTWWDTVLGSVFCVNLLQARRLDWVIPDWCLPITTIL